MMDEEINDEIAAARQARAAADPARGGQRPSSRAAERLVEILDQVLRRAPARSRAAAGRAACGSPDPPPTPGARSGSPVPPRLVARVNSFTRRTTPSAASAPPFTCTETIPPKPAICRAATAWPGIARESGVVHHLDRRVRRQERGDRAPRSRSARASARAGSGCRASAASSRTRRAPRRRAACRVRSRAAHSSSAGEHQRAAGQIAVAAEVLGGRVHHQRRSRARADAGARAWPRCCRRRSARPPRARSPRRARCR